MAAVYDLADFSAQEHINQALKKAIKRKRSNTGGKWQSLEDRLFDCYVESCEGAPLDKRFCHGVRLLEKVVLQDNLSALVVNLYPGNEGYSLMLKGKNGADSETVRLPYEESEFLDYLDAQELPPLLVDLLEKSQANVFYSGCVVVEVRDYRRTLSPATYDSSYVLLRPTIQSLICDINALTSDGTWTQEDKHSLESQLLVATQPALCLDPSPEVVLIGNQLQYHQHMFNTHAVKRCIKRHSQSHINKCSVMASTNSSSSRFKVIDFLAHHKRSQPPVNLRLAKTPNCVDSWKQRQLNLPKPSRVEAELFAKVAERPKFESNSLPETVQEIILEGEKTNNRAYYCRVTIQRRPSDQQYVGELYLVEDNRTNDTNKGSGHSCKFLLGSKRNAQRYLQQFQDLYTEEGRKSVKISSIIPGQPPPSTTQTTATATVQSVPTPQQPNTAAAATSNSSGITVVNQPVKMVVSSVGSTTGNSFTVGSVASVGSVTAFVPTTLPAQNQIVHQQGSVRSVNVQQQYGQKVTVYQHGTQVTSPSAASVVQTLTTQSSTTKLPVPGTFYTTGQPIGQSIMTVPSGAVKTHALPTSIQQTVTNINRRGSITEIGSNTPIQSPTTPSGQFTNVVGQFMQAGTVTVPAGVTVTTPGTQLVGTGNIQTQYLTTNLKPGQSIHSSPSGPVTILQGTTTIQPQQTQIVQQRGQTSSFTTIPANLVPISQVPTVVTTLSNIKMSQAQTSVQPHILRSNPLSPPMTSVVTSRPIQIHQQQPRKISPGPGPNSVTSPQGVAIPSSPTAIAALTSTVNRTTQNVQPLVPLTTQLPQQQFQVRMVQFQQQQIPVQPQGTISITPQQQVTRIQQQARARGQGRSPNPRRRVSQSSQNK